MKCCIHLKWRKKKGVAYNYCTDKKRIIGFDDCKRCPNKCYKKYKPMKKVSKHRETVSPETYANVFMRCEGRCAICGTTRNLHYHHILYRSQRHDLIDEPKNGIMLCITCHQKIHSNKKYWQPLLVELVKTQSEE